MVRSMDLRARLLAAVDRQSSCRAAADRFGVAPSTAVRWRVQQREAGDIAPKPRGGDMRSRRMEERAADILAIWEERRDITLEELRLALADKGMAVSVAGLHRFFVRRGLALQVQQSFGRDPYAGGLYIFRGRRGDLCKIIWHDGVGMSLYAKRLERGKYIWPSAVDGVIAISPSQMACMLEAIDWRNPQAAWRPTLAG